METPDPLLITSVSSRVSKELQPIDLCFLVSIMLGWCLLGVWRMRRWIELVLRRLFQQWSLEQVLVYCLLVLWMMNRGFCTILEIFHTDSILLEQLYRWQPTKVR